jgi:hypothetical protein
VALVTKPHLLAVDWDRLHQPCGRKPPDRAEDLRLRDLFPRCSEIGIDDFQANRGPDMKVSNNAAKGLWTQQKGGFYHDGRFATVRDVVEHYDKFLQLSLSEPEKTDLVDYLLSL